MNGKDPITKELRDIKKPTGAARKDCKTPFLPESSYHFHSIISKRFACLIELGEGNGTTLACSNTAAWRCIDNILGIA